jgi:hypothetical protein
MTTPRRSYSFALALTAATVIFLVLAIGALGIVGDGGRADRIFLVVPVVLGLGALLARFRPRGMVWATTATAVVQALVAVAAVVAVTVELDDFAGASIGDIVMINTLYVALFGLAAWRFRRSTPASAPSKG